MEQNFPPAAPKSWDYNPSSLIQRKRVALGAAIAMAIALYLGLYQWRLIPTVWDPLFRDGTERVLDSAVSHAITNWIRIPDAILGAIAYFSDVVFALAGSERRWQDRPWLTVLFGIDVIPLGLVSVILVVLQGLVVHSWCFLCLITATISLTLVFLAYGEVVSSLLYLYETYRLSGSWRTMWATFWGFPSEKAYEAGLIIAARRKKKGK